MEIIILAGGLGTRLCSKVKDVPKCMAPVIGKQFLWYLLKDLKKYGNISRIILSVVYLREVIFDWFPTVQNKFPFSFDYSTRRSLLELVEIRLAMKKVTKEEAFILNGDTYFDVYLNELLDFRRTQADVKLAIADKTHLLKDMLALMDEAERILCDRNVSLNEFGKLLDTTWKLKRGTGAKVSYGSIDELYSQAMNAGALSGKLLGAGGGSFLLFYCKKKRQPTLIKAMETLMIFSFNFETGGAQVLYYAPQSYSQRIDPFFC